MKLDAPHDPEREHLRGIRVISVVTDDFAISHNEDGVGVNSCNKPFLNRVQGQAE